MWEQSTPAQKTKALRATALDDGPEQLQPTVSAQAASSNHTTRKVIAQRQKVIGLRAKLRAKFAAYRGLNAGRWRCRCSLAMPSFVRKTIRIAKRLAQPFSKRNLLEAAHVMGPTLTALLSWAPAAPLPMPRERWISPGPNADGNLQNVRDVRGRCHLSRRPDLRRNPHDEREGFRTPFPVFSARCSAPESWDGAPVG